MSCDRLLFVVKFFQLLALARTYILHRPRDWRALVRPTIREGVDACRATHPPSAVRAVRGCFVLFCSLPVSEVDERCGCDRACELWLSSCQQHTSRRGTCGSRPPWRRRRPDDRRVTSPKTHPDIHVRTSSPNRNATALEIGSKPVCHKSSCSDGDPSIERWYQDVSPPAHLPGGEG